MHYKAAIVRHSKLFPSLFVVLGIVGLSAIAFLDIAAITKQMDSWQLLPKQQRFTELYFSDLHKIPNSVNADTEHDVAFTLRNLEHVPTTYHYKISAVTSDNHVAQVLSTGDVSLGNNESKNIHHIVTIPSINDSRAGIRVELEYQGIAMGDATPSLEKQSIQYWVKLEGKTANES